MRFTRFRRSSQAQPPSVGSDPVDSGTAFQGFRQLTANFTQVPNELWDLRMPGLSLELRWTLLALTRVTVGEAYRRGGSAYDFIPIPWARWMDMLELQTVNAVKNRLARAEELGLIEVLPGTRGAGGTTPNHYRLRWVHDGHAASRAFHAAMRTRSRELERRQQARARGGALADSPMTPGGSPANTPGGSPPNPPLTPGPSPANTPPANPPRVFGQTNSPSIKQTEYPGTPSPYQSVSPSGPETSRLTDKEIKINNNQSVSPSRLENNGPTEPGFDGLTDRIVELEINSDLGGWLKGAASEPWPEVLRLDLGTVLAPFQVMAIEQRSPWSAEGVRAILDAIRAKGRKLGNLPGTVWNALLRKEKGAVWLAKVGPLHHRAEWRRKEYGIPAADRLASPGGERPAPEGDSHRPWPWIAPCLLPTLRVESPGWESDPFPDDEECEPEREEPVIQDCAERVTRPEELSPEVKAELRALIETFREATREAIRCSGASRPGSLNAFSRSWESIVSLLEPVLPLQVNLPDEWRPVAIRRRSQIKLNVINAVYLAVS